MTTGFLRLSIFAIASVGFIAMLGAFGNQQSLSYASDDLIQDVPIEADLTAFPASHSTRTSADVTTTITVTPGTSSASSSSTSATAVSSQKSQSTSSVASSSSSVDQTVSSSSSQDHSFVDFFRKKRHRDGHDG